MPTQPQSTAVASAFQIKEIEGQGRVVILTGRAMPARPFTLKGTQRMEVTFYQGNPIGSAQVQGPEEGESSLRGKWNDRFIKNAQTTPAIVIGFDDTTGEALVSRQNLPPAVVDGTPVIDVMDLAKTFDSIRREGALCEVTWDEITRIGLLKDFTQTWHRRQDLEWEMTFAWLSQGEPSGSAIFSLQTGMEGVSGEMSQLSGELSDLTENPPFSLDGGVQEALDGAVEQILEVSDEITGAVLNVQQAVSQPLDGARRVAAALSTVVEQANEVLTALESLPLQALRGAQDLFSVGLGATMSIAKFVTDVRETALQIRSAAIDRQRRLQRRITSDLLTVYVARGGEDLRNVATRFYGKPDDYMRILRYNRLTSSLLTAGQKILVPKPQASELRL